MRRFFNILLGALAMIAVGLLSAFIAMRLAIHGREVEVPDLAGLTVAEAKGLASGLGLNVNVENRFYSTVTPAGRILSQYPAPGIKVRREWVLRVAESTGPQKVSVPDVIGKTEREATVTIRRLALDLGTVAYIPAPGPPGIVLSQTPTPAAAGVDGPRISLLVSEPIATAKARIITPDAPPETPASEAAAPASPSSPSPASDPPDIAAAGAVSEDAFVMPNLVGLTFFAANKRVAAMGLRISSVEAVTEAIRPVAPVTAPASPGAPVQQAVPRPIAPMAPITLANTVVAQTPAAGRRVTKKDAIKITVSH
jgi:beta-lactam-binding protein with PASTA domain